MQQQQQQFHLQSRANAAALAAYCGISARGMQIRGHTCFKRKHHKTHDSYQWEVMEGNILQSRPTYIFLRLRYRWNRIRACTSRKTKSPWLKDFSIASWSVGKGRLRRRAANAGCGCGDENTKATIQTRMQWRRQMQRRYILRTSFQLFAISVFALRKDLSMGETKILEINCSRRDVRDKRASRKRGKTRQWYKYRRQNEESLVQISRARLPGLNRHGGRFKRVLSCLLWWACQKRRRPRRRREPRLRS